MPDIQVENKPKRNAKGQLLPGYSGNLKGRPVGTSLKEYQAQKYRTMSPEEKEAELLKMSDELKWKMAEGAPGQEITGKDGKDLIAEPSERIKELAKKLKELDG